MRDFCARSEFGLSELGTRASLECRLPSGVLVDFHWFASSERLEDVFAEDAENADLTAGGDCTAEQWSYRGTWSVGAGNPAVGKLLCFTSGEEARVVWTYDDMSLFAHAVRADGDIGRLHRWWSDVAAATHTL
ncbi:MAG TPA: hypothetical protein VFJ14_08220 [Nocardioidaceae bacterium]|nr:hypothetical protein [Nocardioidaceae bacterium]